MAMTFALPAHAIDWRFEPRVSGSATYSDNVNQSATNKDSGLSLSVTPGFSLRSEGSRRVQATVQYGLTAVSRFGGNDTSDDLYHNLSAAGKAELVEDFLFVDGTANVSQQLISLLGSPADATVNGSNRTTVGTYSLSPYILKRLGTFAQAQARYTASGSIFDSNAASDSSTNTFSAGLSSGTQFNDLSWSLDYYNSKTEYNRGPDTTFERTSATLGYALSRKFRVFGSFGEDKNEYLSATDTSGSFYRAGFGWTPTRRTSIEASGGESYFGPTYSLAASLKTRQTRWELRYSEDVSDMSHLTTDYSKLTGALINSCPAGTVLPPNPTLIDVINAGCSVDLFFGTSISNSVFVYKLLTAGMAWDMSARTRFSVRLSDMTREFQLTTQGQDQVQTATAGINYRLSPTLSANGDLSFTRNSLDAAATGGAAREDDIVSFILGLNRRFSKDLNGALTFRHTQRDSNDANANFDENSLTATATMRF